MKELLKQLQERIFENKILLQQQLNLLLADGYDKERNLTLEREMCKQQYFFFPKEDISSFYQVLSSANTIEEIEKIFLPDVPKFVSFYPLSFTIYNQLYLLIDMEHHIKKQADLNKEYEALKNRFNNLA